MYFSSFVSYVLYITVDHGKCISINMVQICLDSLILFHVLLRRILSITLFVSVYYVFFFILGKTLRDKQTWILIRDRITMSQWFFFFFYSVLILNDDRLGSMADFYMTRCATVFSHLGWRRGWAVWAILKNWAWRNIVKLLSDPYNMSGQLDPFPWLREK